MERDKKGLSRSRRSMVEVPSEQRELIPLLVTHLFQQDRVS